MAKDVSIKYLFPNNEMVNTMSGVRQYNPSLIRAHIADQVNQALPSPLGSTMDPTMQQFFAAQMQLLQNLTATIQNMQAQQNQPPPHAPPPPPNKHKEFMSHHPHTYSHSVDPLDADYWLKTINKMLNITQCNDREKVLYASRRLEGAASDRWDAYTAAHAAANTIT
jgi:hypothetical protein